MSESAPTAAETRRIAEEARDRVRFEEEALQLSDQVYRVARRLAGSREEAEDLVQDTYARAFRSWQQYQPGTNLRAWLLRILTNLNIDRGRRVQRTPEQTPLEMLLCFANLFLAQHPVDIRLHHHLAVVTPAAH